MTIVKAQRHPELHASHDPTSIAARLHLKGTDEQRRILLPIPALTFALKANHGMALLDVQLPGDGAPRHVIVSRTRASGLVLTEVTDADRIRTLVPVVPKGVLPSRRRRLAVTQIERGIELSGPVSVLMHPVGVDVSSFDTGDVVVARNIELPAGASLCSDPDQIILRVDRLADA